MRTMIPQSVKTTVFAILILIAGSLFLASPTSAAQQADTSPQANAPKKTRAVGTVKSVNGNTITLTTDTGSEINVLIGPTTRLVRMAPGQTDLKSAPAIQLSDVQVGDRLLAGGTPSDDGKSVAATSAVVMKKSDVAEKQEHDREEWQKHGTGGVVKAVDAGAGSITLSTGTLGAPNTLIVHVSKDTIIRRYAPDSVKFDDAKPGTLEQIKAGDQLRVRGTKSDDGKEMAAAEIVSGSFRSIAGVVVSADAASNTITVTDLANKRPVTLKVASDSQMHKLPAMFAQRIAMRLKGGAAPPTGGSAAAGTSAGGGAGNGSAPRAQGGHALADGGASPGGVRPGGAPDFQQMLNRMPAASLSDLQKGDALMIVATEGSAESPSTVIILLSGVEPILAAASPSQASTILSPWNLSTGANAGTGDTP
jgi:Cu/Ag efflux protein CusF